VFFCLVIILFSSKQDHGVSSERKVEIQDIAERICSVRKVEPCPVKWSGKSRWIGSIGPQNERFIVNLEEMRQALPPTEWTESVTRDGPEFSKGIFLVIYHIRTGKIVITTVK